MPAFLSLIDLGHALERAGFDVGEHPAFGGVAPVHTDNSHHYRPKTATDNFGALDINWPGGGSAESAKLKVLQAALKRAGLEELIHDHPTLGHKTHLHAAAEGPIRITKPLDRLLGLGIGRHGGAGFNPSFPVPGVPGGSWTPQFTVPEYPTKPLPIPASALAGFAEARAAAQRNIREARIAAQRGGREINSSFRRFVNDLDRKTAEGREEVMGQASARNLAFQPGFVAPRLSEVREDRSAAIANAVAEKAEALGNLRQGVQQARRQKRDVLADIRRDRGRMRSELDRLIGI